MQPELNRKHVLFGNAADVRRSTASGALAGQVAARSDAEASRLRGLRQWDPQKFTQYHARQSRRAGDVVEMRPGVTHDAAGGIGFGVHGGADGVREPVEYTVKYHAVERLLVLEVVI